MTEEDFQREAEAMRPMLLQAATALLGNAEDGEDAVQDALLKLWGMAEEPAPPGGSAGPSPRAQPLR